MSAPRLNKERTQFQNHGYQVIIQNDNVWNTYFMGPEGTPFEGGQFVLEWKFQNFPFKGPIVSFKTKIYHPNVDQKGQICADMLQTGTAWAPTKRLVKVLQKIISLMVVPNLQQPINQQAAMDYQNKTWHQKALDITKQYALINHH